MTCTTVGVDPRSSACHRSVRPGPGLQLVGSTATKPFPSEDVGSGLLDKIGFPWSPPMPNLPPRSPKVKGNWTLPRRPAPSQLCLQLAAPKRGDAQPGPAQFPRSRGSRGVPGQPQLCGTERVRRYGRNAAGQKPAEGEAPGEGLSRRASRGALTCAVRWSLPGPRRPQAGATSAPAPPLPPKPTQREWTLGRIRARWRPHSDPCWTWRLGGPRC